MLEDYIYVKTLSYPFDNEDDAYTSIGSLLKSLGNYKFMLNVEHEGRSLSCQWDGDNFYWEEKPERWVVKVDVYRRNDWCLC